jgi:hypothetical protein
MLGYDYLLTRRLTVGDIAIVVDSDLCVGISVAEEGFVNLNSAEVIELAEALKKAQAYATFLRANLEAICKKAQENIGPLPTTSFEEEAEEQDEEEGEE